MLIYRDKEIERRFVQGGLRPHQWDYAEHDPRHRYVDFKVYPELVEETLLDFHPWQHFAEVGEFYELIRWLNGPESVLETNDCGFRGPHPNEKQDQPRKDLDLAWRASGRVMVLWRDLHLNVSAEPTEWLAGAIEHYARQIDRPWTEAVLGLAFAETRYDTISPLAVGRQLSVEWWLWGKSEDDVMAGLGRLVRDLRELFGHVSREVRESVQGTAGS